MTDTVILHEYAPSGNCYKIRLTAALLGLPIERRHYNIMAGETRTPDFLAQVNANGRIPVLQIGTRFLPESNAASYWLATGSPLIPADRFDHADMLRWVFFEQYNHEPNVATLRFWLAFIGVDALSDAQRGQIAGKRTAGEAALTLMEDALESRDWLVGNAPSLADIALFAYTHVAEEGGFDLAGRAPLTRWIERVKNLSGYIPLSG
jgi:glutathione S-transferase